MRYLDTFGTLIDSDNGCSKLNQREGDQPSTTPKVENCLPANITAQLPDHLDPKGSKIL
jgi:hypothetical protein